MSGQRDIPKEWQENKSLIFASKVVGRPILSTNELNVKELNMVTVALLKNMIKIA